MVVVFWSRRRTSILTSILHLTGPIYGLYEQRDMFRFFLFWSEPELSCSEWATAVWCSFYWVRRALQQSAGNDSVDQVFLIILGHKLPLSLVFKDNDNIYRFLPWWFLPAHILVSQGATAPVACGILQLNSAPTIGDMARASVNLACRLNVICKL